MRKTIGLLICLGSLGLWASAARAQTVAAVAPTVPVKRSAPAPRPVDPRWQPSLDAFAAADRLKAPRPGGVLFVGSSSIRLWDGLERQFGAGDEAVDGPVVIKRGFGGSRLVDVAQYLDRLVLPYRPRLVVVYAGDNDLAEGRRPHEVLESFRSLVDGVQRELPQTRIAYVSIKPSPLRESLMPQIRETNALIRDYAGSTPGLDYIDIHTPMLGADGRPRGELFRADALHLNEAGYALWKTVIASHLGAPAPRAAPTAVLHAGP
jgi:lysophospholipase L1-like esterase